MGYVGFGATYRIICRGYASIQTTPMITKVAPARPVNGDAEVEAVRSRVPKPAQHFIMGEP